MPGNRNGNGNGRKILIFDMCGDANEMIISEQVLIRAIMGSNARKEIHQIKKEIGPDNVFRFKEGVTPEMMAGCIFKAAPAEVRGGGLGQAVIAMLESIVESPCESEVDTKKKAGRKKKPVGSR